MFCRFPTHKTSSLVFSLYYNFTVRVRYAPSPTGFMHIGGLRTALFNYLFARKFKGQFIVRIEDTDKKREVEGSIDDIFNTLQWAGITADESIKNGGEFGPYIQSERMHIYKNWEKQLLKSNKAYPCFCMQTDKNQTEVQPHRYDGKCRSLSFQQIKSKIMNKQQYAVRIKSDLIPHPPVFFDEVFGELQFKQLDDFVIVRRNGWPTFHFANVIDDWQMKITHVMRGEEWLTNTNKHIYLYMVLGANVPKFVHLPLIKAMNGKKLAKRDPTSSVKNFQKGQYEMQAIKSFLGQLGLNRLQNKTEQKDEKSQIVPEDQSKSKQQSKPEQKPIQKTDNKNKSQSAKKEDTDLKLLRQSQMIEQFDLSRITRVPVKFDLKQLDFLNKLALKNQWKYAKQLPNKMDRFINLTIKLIPSASNYSREYIISAIDSVIQRFNFITDISFYEHYFEQPDYLEEKSKEDFQKIFGKGAKMNITNTQGSLSYYASGYDPQLHVRSKKIVHNLRMILEHVIDPKDYNDITIAKRLSQFLYQSPELRNQDVFHLLRYMITGRKSGPNITLACAIIGRDKILQRLKPFSDL